MSVLDWNLRPGIRRQFGTSSRTVLTPAVRIQKDCTLSGRGIFFLMLCRIADENHLRVCVPASDAIAGELGGGAEEILGIGTGEHLR